MVDKRQAGFMMNRSATTERDEALAELAVVRKQLAEAMTEIARLKYGKTPSPAGKQQAKNILTKSVK